MVIENRPSQQVRKDKPKYVINIEKSLSYIVHLIAELSATMDREVDALEKYDIENFLIHQGEKARLVKSFEFEAQKLLAVREKLKEIDPELRRQIRESKEDFIRLMSKNATMLEKRLASTQRINERILESAREAVSEEDPFYTASGNRSSSARKTISSGLTETI